MSIHGLSIDTRKELANLNLIGKEEDAFHKKAAMVDQKYQFSLVGRYLTGENPLLILLSLSKIWVQIHDLPPGLMTETMAKQFGDFLGQFLENDTSISTMGIQKFMRIRIRLDVTIP
ncbi:hypothetical protein Goklo_012657, partial [Gossypium klotzschianum]|nr:hypothetical protein [Gossypium klotzschianum]